MPLIFPASTIETANANTTRARAIRRISHGSTTKFISEIPSCSNKRLAMRFTDRQAAREPASVPPTDAGRKLMAICSISCLSV